MDVNEILETTNCRGLLHPTSAVLKSLKLLGNDSVEGASNGILSNFLLQEKITIPNKLNNNTLISYYFRI
jgi:hypothetical protein